MIDLTFKLPGKAEIPAFNTTTEYHKKKCRTGGKMSNKLARAKNKIYVTGLLAITSNGDVINLNTSKVSVIDNETNKPLFTVKKKEK